MAKIIYTNWSCEIFEGFYESSLYNCDSLYWINKENEDGKEYDVDFPAFTLQTAKKAVCCLFEALPNLDVIQDLEFVALVSPQFYNYNTDKLQIEVKYDKRKLKAYIRKNESDFRKHLKYYFTDRDGFISFVPNDYDSFMAWDDNRREEVMIEYYLLNEIDLDDYKMSVREYADEALYNNLFEVKG